MKTLSKILILISFLMIILLPGSGISQQVVEYIGQGDYVMGDGETPAIAESRALKLAERDAAEQAGVFIKSSTFVKDMAVIDDVIETVAKHSMSVQVIERRRTPITAQNQGTGEAATLKFSVRIKATFQKLDIEKNLMMIRENSRYVDSYRKLKGEYEHQRKELEDLKRKLSLADEKHRQNILKKIGAEEKRYEAVKLIEAGEVALMYNDKMSALESFTSAIALHPEFAPAYGMRGAVYMELNQNEKAYADVQKAIELDPQDAFYYATRGAVTFEGCSKVNPSACEQTLKDMNTAIGLQPNSPELYLMRAGVYLETNRNKEALRDLAKTNELDRTAYWPAASGIAHILMIKGLKDSTNDLQGILALLTESISTVTHSKYYLDVLKPMSEAVNEMREKNASADQAKEILARRSIELPDEKTSMILTDNINFVFALYAERADTYAKLGYHGKAKIDLKTACRIIWKEEFCESKSPASVTD